ncbi:MAG: CbbQ/NirQ/NorQ/GpvN family protein [Magnetococcales bacterium]|nr:CbbQ/NirQ/NorQ/GpvN family protein [Magnetococcales bacterium]
MALSSAQPIANPADLFKPEENRIVGEPYYQASGAEIEVFTAAFGNRLPVLLKGPTGCGKSRFVAHMAWRLARPLITISCHEDMTAADLVGRFLVVGGDTLWQDGPLTQAVRHGGICYLDEIVEARKDTMVVIHPLADDRRILPVEKLGGMLRAHADFCLVISYNPGYQSVLKELKPSTRQRFVALSFDYPDFATEVDIIARETGIAVEMARRLVEFGRLTRNLKGGGLDEGASTRLLVHAAQLIRSGVSANTAIVHTVAQALSDEPEMIQAINALGEAVFS